MKDELFDIVDSQDRVIGQRYRSEVHQLGLRHRSVHLFAFNTETPEEFEQAAERLEQSIKVLSAGERWCSSELPPVSDSTKR